MATHALDLVNFRALFPEFATTPNDAQLAAYWGMATQYMSPNDGVVLYGDTLQLGLNLMTAHLAKSMTLISSGKQSVVVSSSSEGSVSVSLVPPPIKSGWQWWLSTTPYGAQLWALLNIKTAGGLMVGGSLERASFRHAGGVFL
jgi:hypothetical protein